MLLLCPLPISAHAACAYAWLNGLLAPSYGTQGKEQENEDEVEDENEEMPIVAIEERSCN